MASKEAQDRYPVGGDGGVSVESIIMDNDNGILQKAYVAGRTAEPMETEIDAAARAMAARNADSTAPEDVDIEFSQWRRDKYLLDAKAALLAARKAVTE
jgi:hypothetical protein